MFRNGLVVLAAVFSFAATSQASIISFITPAGATTSGAVDASAAFTTEAGAVLITLTDLEPNPGDVAQLISDLEFTLSDGAESGTLASSSGQQITVNGGGTYSVGSTTSTGWGVNNSVNGGLELDALGYVGPAGLIIGPPSSADKYSNANSSIAGNGPHNPFINQSATFTVDIAGVTASTTITSATFSFGTTEGQYDIAGVVDLPEPSTVLLLVFGTGALGLLKLRRRAD